MLFGEKAEAIKLPSSPSSMKHSPLVREETASIGFSRE
jgi:hypothetical protein